MESAFSTLGFVIFALSISIYAIVVESHSRNGRSVVLMLRASLASRPPPPPPPPPPPSPTPSPPPAMFPPPPPISPPPPPMSPPPQPMSPPPQPMSPPPPLTPPPPPPPPHAPPFWLNKDESKRQPPPPLSFHKTHSSEYSRRPTATSHQTNAGKTIGLLFVGIAAIMQIGVVGFLVFKRKQLLTIKDRYETGS